MFLFDDTTLAEFETKGTSFGNILKGVNDALKKTLQFETAIESITAMDDEAKKLQRTLGSGIINIGATNKGATQLRTTITNIFNESVKFGSSFENVTGGGGGNAAGGGSGKGGRADVVAWDAV